MFGRFRGSLTYANVTSTLALFLALGGVSYAAVTLPRNSVGALQIRKNAVTRAKIKRDAVTGAKVKDGSLTAADFRKLPSLQQGTPGPTGPTGPKGDTGAAGPIGLTGLTGAPGLANLSVTSSDGPDTSSTLVEHQTNCPAGKKVVGGGGLINGGVEGGNPVVVIRRSYPVTYPDEGWIVQAAETTPTSSTWSITVQAVCAAVS